MTDERYIHLEKNGEKLTDQEREEGWHYCHEWDGMLIYKTWPEAECCLCKSS